MLAEAIPRLGQDDRELQGRVVSELRQTRRPSLQRLGVEVRQGIVHLRGCVQSFYEKQLAMHTCMRAAGVGRVIDAVEVPVE